MYRRRNSQPQQSVTVTPREFIEAWQASSSVAEVAQKVRSKKNACRVRAFRYRELGIPLKEIPTSPPVEPIDWDELAEYAESLLPECDAEPPSDEETPEDGAGDEPRP